MNILKLGNPLIKTYLAFALSVSVGNIVAKNLDGLEEPKNCEITGEISSIDDIRKCYIQAGLLDGRKAIELPEGIIGKGLIDLFENTRGDKNFINFSDTNFGNRQYRLFYDLGTKTYWIIFISDGKSSYKPNRNSQFSEE